MKDGAQDLFQEEKGSVLPFLDPIDPKHEDQRDLLEALIFASLEALDTNKLAEKLEWDPERVLGAIDRLNLDYEEQGRSFELLQVAGGWQLVSRRRYGGLLKKLLKEQVLPRLSRAALETLSVIAYRQPVTKADVEAVRGVKADGVVRTLLERELIQITGRADSVGRPLLYRTTRTFLERFELASLKDLPRRQEVDEWLKGLKENEDLPPDPLQERIPEEDPESDALADAAVTTEDTNLHETLVTDEPGELEPDVDTSKSGEQAVHVQDRPDEGEALDGEEDS